MNQRDQLNRLLDLARRAPKDSIPRSEESAPFGFATRVAGQWAASQKTNTRNSWERACWWGATVSLSICLLVSVQRAMEPEPNAFDLVLAMPETSAVPSPE